MTSYRLTPDALDDLEKITSYLLEEWGDGLANKVEEELISAFERLSETPGLGHRRADLADRPLFFYFVDPYFIVYGRGVNPLPILAVLHSSRNIRRVLKSRHRR